MSVWLKKPKKTDASGLSADINRLAEIFRSVESTDHCLNLYHYEGLLEYKGWASEKIDLLENVCDQLRTQGLGLEPNLMGRTIANTVLDRHLAGSVSIRLAKADTDFCELISQADSAKGQGDFHAAQYSYWQALKLFPAHPGCRIQYGHCLKERGLMEDALHQYIDSYYFGAPKEDVESHALFVANSFGRYAAVTAIFKRQTQHAAHGQKMLDWSVTSKDVITLTNFMLGRHPSIDEITSHICECINIRDLLYALLGEKDFVRTHRDTLRLLSETGWNVK